MSKIKLTEEQLAALNGSESFVVSGLAAGKVSLATDVSVITLDLDPGQLTIGQSLKVKDGVLVTDKAQEQKAEKAKGKNNPSPEMAAKLAGSAC
ncbi:hypothetical protein [Klebsiella quasipneumoniae]|uniref:hypothetical protein n=1 Tax=Klebsiella quasipneumoniae TaxID=1463165 RepID=UPI0023B002EB|nr:hypothetical protein [Klebsiella quasipneumoniae]